MRLGLCGRKGPGGFRSRGGRGTGRNGLHRLRHGLQRLCQIDQCQFQLNALVAAAGHVLQRVAQQPDGPDGFPLAQRRAFLQIEGFFLGRDTGQQRLPAGQGRQHQGPVVGNELIRQPLDVHRVLLPQLGQTGQRRGTILGGNGVRDAEQVAPVGHARHLADNAGVDLGGHTRAGVQDGQRIAHGTIRQAGDELRALGGQLQVLLPGDVLHPPGNVLRDDAGKIIPLAAGEDGLRHFLDLGRGQDEDDVGGRLLQRFEQGVERRRREHVHLVDDIYFIPALAGGVGRLIPQAADIVHAVVGGRVHLHHVQDAAVVDTAADGALAAGVAVVGVEAVDRLGKDLGAGGLARAAHACKQVGVANAPGGHLVAQRGHRAVLGHHILKPLGSPLAVQRAIHPALLL